MVIKIVALMRATRLRQNGLLEPSRMSKRNENLKDRKSNGLVEKGFIIIHEAKASGFESHGRSKSIGGNHVRISIILNKNRDMMKKNMMMVVPQTLIMSWVSFFFSGFVLSNQEILIMFC